MKNGAATVLCLLYLSAALPAHAEDAADAKAVRELLMRTFDRSEARLLVEPVVVQDDAAIAGWSQGELGGRAFLRRKDGVWTIALCAGDALSQSATLEKLGIAKPRAEALAATLIAAERTLPRSLLERFSRFDGMVAVDAAGVHAPLDPHHRPAP